MECTTICIDPERFCLDILHSKIHIVLRFLIYMNRSITYVKHLKSFLRDVLLLIQNIELTSSLSELVRCPLFFFSGCFNIISEQTEGYRSLHDCFELCAERMVKSVLFAHKVCFSLKLHCILTFHIQFLSKFHCYCYFVYIINTNSIGKFYNCLYYLFCQYAS